ncbi:hypothetical protein RAS1_25890 [Phycisphaerae bacterium RAS1]|nr:hypothetical protein RAS1_25890 [Phycisphaerae bacterium RAS1]
MGCTRSRISAGILIAAALAARAAAADTVKLSGRPPFVGVRIVAFREHRLIFRGVSGELLRKPHAEIEWIEADDLPRLGEAEHAAAEGRDPDAAAAYESVLRDAAAEWVGPWAKRRLAAVCDRCGRFDRAVELCLELGGDCRPRRLAPAGSSENAAARTRLKNALTGRNGPLAREMLVDLELYEDRDPRILLHGPATQAADSRPVYGLLSGSAAATAPVIQLAPTAILLESLRAELERGGDATRVLRVLERTLEFTNADAAGPWKLLLGRARIEAGRHAEAFEQLLALANAGGPADEASWALCYAALAAERMGRTDVAVGLYSEVLERDGSPVEARAAAEAGNRRVRKP